MKITRQEKNIFRHGGYIGKMIGQRIKEVRISHSLSQAVFGDRIGISTPSVSRIETGENTPSEQTIRLILSEFNVREQWLREGSGDMMENDRALKKTKLIDKYNTEGDPFKDWLLDQVLDLGDDQWELLKEKIAAGAEYTRAHPNDEQGKAIADQAKTLRESYKQGLNDGIDLTKAEK